MATTSATPKGYRCVVYMLSVVLRYGQVRRARLCEGGCWRGSKSNLTCATEGVKEPWDCDKSSASGISCLQRPWPCARRSGQDAEAADPDRGAQSEGAFIGRPPDVAEGQPRLRRLQQGAEPHADTQEGLSGVCTQGEGVGDPGIGISKDEELLKTN